MKKMFDKKIIILSILVLISCNPVVNQPQGSPSPSITVKPSQQVSSETPVSTPTPYPTPTPYCTDNKYRLSDTVESILPTWISDSRILFFLNKRESYPSYYDKDGQLLSAGGSAPDSRIAIMDKDGLNKKEIIKNIYYFIPTGTNGIDGRKFFNDSFYLSPHNEKIIYNNWDFAEHYKPFNLININGTNEQLLFKDYISFPIWSSDNKEVIFSSNNEVFKVNTEDKNLKTEKLNVQGWPILWNADNSIIISKFTTSDDKTLYTIYSLDLQTKETKELFNILLLDKSLIGDYFVSPDSKRLAYTVYNSQNDYSEIYTVNLDGTEKTQLIKIPYTTYFLSWSADSKKILFTPSQNEISEIDVNTKKVNSILKSENPKLKYAFPSWSPDGKEILFSSNTASLSDKFKNSFNGNDPFNIYLMKSDGSNVKRITSNVCELISYENNYYRN